MAYANIVKCRNGCDRPIALCYSFRAKRWYPAELHEMVPQPHILHSCQVSNEAAIAQALAEGKTLRAAPAQQQQQQAVPATNAVAQPKPMAQVRERVAMQSSAGPIETAVLAKEALARQVAKLVADGKFTEAALLLAQQATAPTPKVELDPTSLATMFALAGVFGEETTPQPAAVKRPGRPRRNPSALGPNPNATAPQPTAVALPKWAQRS